jgi:hypothetical protein
MKRIITLLLLVFIAANGFAQDRRMMNRSDALEDGKGIPGYTGIFSPERGGSYPFAVPNASSFFDYGTNGSNLSQLWVFGTTIIFAYFGADSTDPTGATSRVNYYLVSTDNGATWSPQPIAMTTLPQRSAYPDVHPHTSGTNIAVTGRLYNGSNSRGGAWSEALLGLGSFTQSNVPNDGRDIFGHYLNGNLVGGMYSIPGGSPTSDTLNFIKYDFSTNSWTGKSVITLPNVDIEANVRYRLTADDTGNNIFAVWWNAPAGQEALVAKRSTDGGATWGSTITIHKSFGPGGVINGDTCSPWFGIDALYKPGTTTPYVAWSTLFPTGTGQSAGDPQGCKILVYSPGINGGLPVEVVGRGDNIAILDTNNLFPIVSMSTGGFQTGVTPVSHPSLGFSSDGSRLVCLFSAGQRAQDTAVGFAYNDIYMCYSDDQGATWSAPRNITNTPDWDELYPQVSETGNGTNQFHIKYQATRNPGSQSFTDLNAVARVYHCYQSITVGVNNISSEVPEKFSLRQNYPNPFNPTTNIRFELTKSAKVTLKVYDVMGKEVATLVNNEQVSAGTQEVIFEAKNLSSGIYFYTLTTADGLRDTKKMTLVK